MTLIDHPENPIPDGAVAGMISTPDGTELRYAHWGSVGGRRRGTVTLLQGRAEFIEKYFETIQDLRKRGFAVITFDWRGQGGSQRLLGNRAKGYISGFRQYRQDLETVLKKVSLTEYPGPHFALAHSTGASILLSDSARLRTMLDRAVLISPLMGLADFNLKKTRPGLYRLIKLLTFGRYPKPDVTKYTPGARNFLERVAFPLAAVFSWIGLARAFVPGGNRNFLIPFSENRQTSDKGRFDRFNAVLAAAPQLGVGSPTVGWLHSAARCMLSFRRRDAGQKIMLPCLIIAAGKDRIVSTRATEEFASRCRAAGFIEIAGAEHELLTEANVYRDQFWAAFDAFVPGSDYE
ncbi:alpha/beta hydrolase [Roseibium aggregatum]|uniref:Alpha/beta hydrolase n=1 Tax=Roseibium aggregatum TaxID=187304 RepID=A0A926P640_9HYPH|nr:alpha/beta hydrolase [Roseibium aggregatum]MBD1548432.1 alpha/beta hydrolase [Roseibium aggregatum]